MVYSYPMGRDATLKSGIRSVTTNNASIPSNYQTVVVDNSEKKGFRSNSKRFSYTDNDLPGPGTYAVHPVLASDGPSFSVKGSAGFPSKAKRLPRVQMPCSPRVGSYNLTDNLNTKKDFNQAGATSSFCHPIALQPDKHANSDGPAANQYNVQVYLGKTNNVAAANAFRSTTKRELVDTRQAQSCPAPWQYTVCDSMVTGNVRVPFSSFKSKTQRFTEKPSENPGSNHYNPYESWEMGKQKSHETKRALVCHALSSTAVPLIVTSVAPGPCTYNIPSYIAGSKQNVPSAAFASGTQRWHPARGSNMLPGPGAYNPVANKRRSFLYNSAGRWVS
ncbi:PREDICTED: O(6)-methylguanine-induced apoptosis 2-like [Priapulus caudatus]|uniref:O(6)-methylguanine-induced apoptosis 2-like n=1 Tax=Priapulus caudatus TaxID=37621 RepID=A0ABM1DPZ2_PRICU|nr:PREDICTED: O(6)-methylguanine-induced apoptosis 2-like [Priapulus caudatus]